MDPITAAEIDQLIVDLQKKRNLTAMVTHDVRGAKSFTDRLVLLKEGRIVAEGSFSDLTKSEDPFASQFLASVL